MRRGTNPIIKLAVSIDTSRIEDAYITFVQDKVIITKPINHCQCEEGVISTQLTQEDTLRFKYGVVQVQARVKLTDGTIDASNIVTIPVEEVLQDGLLFEEAVNATAGEAVE